MNFRAFLFGGFLLALGLTGCATDESSRVVMTMPHGWQQLSINELMTKQLRHDVPIHVRIPAIYIGHPARTVIGAIWSVESDWQALSKGKEAGKENGYLIAQISMNLGYSASKDLFFSNTSDEHGMLTEMIKQGWRDVSVNRFTANGYPVLIIEATQSDGAWSRMLYLGLKAGTSTVFLHYHGRQPWSDLDTLTWETLKSSVLNSKAK